MKKFLCNVMAFAAVLVMVWGCQDLFSGLSSVPSLRPSAIDLNGVTGFVVVDNTTVSRTKSDPNTDLPQALYSIDKNGDIKITVFYFEPTEENGNNADGEVLKEISNALQVVPSLVTDMGKYIVFSGCKYQIIDADMSDEARKICESFTEKNDLFQDMVYMIRKSDGALFDLTERFFFNYCDIQDSWEKPFIPHYAPGLYIQEDSYLTSVKNNVFVQGSQPRAIYKVEDNGDAVDVRQMTQEIIGGEFCVDKDENIYIINWGTIHDYGKEIHIYNAKGGFNLHRFDEDLYFLDLITDESGDPYIFLMSMNREAVSARMTDCKVDIISKSDFSSSFFNYKEFTYLGCYNDSYNWCDYSNILSYDKKTHNWSLRAVSNDILQILAKNYDTIIYGGKTYCATVKNNSIEVIEIDFATETIRKYTLDVDMTSIIPSSFKGRMNQNVPYMIIDGRSPINGANVSFTIDLVNGTNNSSYAPDGRNVVSFFRIN